MTTHGKHLVPVQFEPQMADIPGIVLQLVQFAKMPNYNQTGM